MYIIFHMSTNMREYFNKYGIDIVAENEFEKELIDKVIEKFDAKGAFYEGIGCYGTRYVEEKNIKHVKIYQSDLMYFSDDIARVISVVLALAMYKPKIVVHYTKVERDGKISEEYHEEFSFGEIHENI